MKISLMKEVDLKEVSQVFKESFNSVSENWSDQSSFEHVKQNFFGDSHWVYRENGKIIGMLMSIVLIREHGPELFIDSVAVLPKFQKKGIGKELWSKAVEYAKANNLHAIRFLSNKNLKSYEWYKSMGYEESGWIELFKPVSSV
ncbi:MAG: GNAT family N-acetyltransferase [bacterium]|nr:GNAT family N-acetyltransferase [bacterium]